jgi:hypothetical protein
MYVEAQSLIIIGIGLSLSQSDPIKGLPLYVKKKTYLFSFLFTCF